MRVSLADLTVESIYKYGYGLLKLTPADLYALDAFEFLEMVEGSLAWHEQERDDLLEWLAWYTANSMVSTGNFKKGTKVEDIKDSLYISAEKARSDQLGTEADRVADIKAEKERLAKRFNLSKDQLNNKDNTEPVDN